MINIKLLLIKPAPYNDESLSSFIQRVSELNGLNPHFLWRTYLNGSHYPQSQMSSIINTVPETVLNISAFQEITGFNRDHLENLTFLPALRKVYGHDKSSLELSSQRIMSSILTSYLRYCPICMHENRYYRLIWQVKELDICLHHKLKLNENCPYCYKQIPFLAPDSIAGICPHCQGNLSNQSSNLISSELTNSRAFEDWLFLLNSDMKSIVQGECIDPKQQLALKLLFIISGKPRIFNKQHALNLNLPCSLSVLLQSARGTCSTKRFTHLGIILAILRSQNISLEEFSSMDLPESFLNSVLMPTPLLKDQHSCIAPWCTSFRKPGTLKRTATSTKQLEDGTKLNYYLYCHSCGTEYAIDSQTKELVERGYFIKLAWYKVRHLILEGKGKRDIAFQLGISLDQSLRCIVYLIANNLIPRHYFNFLIPKIPQPQIVDRFLLAIKNSDKIKDLKKILNLPYTEFLYYWYLPNVQVAWLSTPGKAKKKQFTKQWIKEFPEAIKQLMNKEEPITIDKVSKILGVNHETLRFHGLLPQIAAAKKHQSDLQKVKRGEMLINKVEDFIRECKLNGTAITSDMLYKNLEVRRTVLVRTHPEITKYIHTILKKQ